MSHHTGLTGWRLDQVLAEGAALRPAGRVADGRRKNRTKPKVRARGEHPFLILKVVFGFAKVRYRDLFKNSQRLTVACALINLFQMRRQLLRLAMA
ncbi:MAG: hypothetical protein KJ041_00975 [Gammaproteobacteria bacterium]|nr:hypothetical protein [Gammaproteobacteria bacterium]